MPKNKIVVYQGGGYKGCIWEPNAFMFDWKGEFQDLASTGCGGITDESKAMEKYKGIRAGRGARGERVYDIFAKKHMVELCQEWASVYLRRFIAEALGEYEGAPDEIRKRVKMAFYCGKCGDGVTELDEVHFVNMQSFGGLMIAATDMVCQECFDTGACDMCKESGSGDDYCYCPDEVVKNDGFGKSLCDFHRDRVVIDLLAEDRIKAEGVGVQLRELQESIRLGGRQLTEMFRLKGVNYDRSITEQHNAGVNEIREDMVDLWKALEPEEQLALTIKETWGNPVPEQDKQPALPVQQ